MPHESDPHSSAAPDSAPELFPKWTIYLILAIIALIAISFGLFRLVAAKALQPGELVLVWPKEAVYKGKCTIETPRLRSGLSSDKANEFEFELTGPVMATLESTSGWGWWKRYQVQFVELGCRGEVDSKDVTVARFADVESVGLKAREEDERRTDRPE